MVLTAPPAPGEFGEFGWGLRSIGRGFKKIGKKVGRATKKVAKKSYRVAKKTGKFAYKYSGTGLIVKGNIALAKFSAKLALLPLKYLLKAVRAIGRVLCNAPPQLLQLACSQAGVDPAFIPLFCTAVRENKWSLGSVRRLLPPALKVAGKLAASGAFPPIVPALAIVKHIPFVNQFVGGDVPVDSASLPTVRRAMDALQIVALADYLGCIEDEDLRKMGIGPPEREQLYDLLAGEVELCEAADRNAMVLGGVTVAATALGFYLLFR